MNKPNVALVIGHNNVGKGSYSPFIKMSENEFFRYVAADVLENGYDVDIYTRRKGGTYGAEMREELAMINAGTYDLAIELHFNGSDNPQANGTEVLCYHKSEKGKRYAKIFNEAVNKLMGIKIRNGGIVEVKSENDRGGYGIMNSKPVWILVEPFFGSNKEDCGKVNPLAISMAIMNVIREVQNGKC